MLAPETITEKINEVIEDTSAPGFRESLEVNAWIELIKGSGGTVRFGISDAMNVYRAREAIANGDDQFN